MMLFNSSIFNFLPKNRKVSLPGEVKLMKAFKITAFLVYKNLGLSNLGYERNEIDYEMDSHLWRRCFLVNFVKFLRTPFLQNTSGRLLLLVIYLMINKKPDTNRGGLGRVNTSPTLVPRILESLAL